MVTNSQRTSLLPPTDCCIRFFFPTEMKVTSDNKIINWMENYQSRQSNSWRPIVSKLFTAKHVIKQATCCRHHCPKNEMQIDYVPQIDLDSSGPCLWSAEEQTEPYGLLINSTRSIITSTWLPTFFYNLRSWWLHFQGEISLSFNLDILHDKTCTS